MKKQSVWLAIFVALGAAILMVTHSVALTIATASVTFPDVFLTGYDQSVLGTTSPWQVDSTDALDGWNATISATNFENGYGGIIYVSNLEFRLLAENISLVSGNPLLPISAQTEFIPLSETATKFISAESGSGDGIYNLLPEFRLRVPAETYAGSYLSTLTITISAGP